MAKMCQRFSTLRNYMMDIYKLFFEHLTAQLLEQAQLTLTQKFFVYTLDKHRQLQLAYF